MTRNARHDRGRAEQRRNAEHLYAALRRPCLLDRVFHNGRLATISALVISPTLGLYLRGSDVPDADGDEFLPLSEFRDRYAWDASTRRWAPGAAA